MWCILNKVQGKTISDSAVSVASQQ